MERSICKEENEEGHRSPLDSMTNEELESIAAATKNRARFKNESEGVKALIGFDVPSDTAFGDIVYYDSAVEEARILVEHLTHQYGAKVAYQISMHMAARSSAVVLYRGDGAQYLNDISDRFERMAPPYLEELDIENDRLRRAIVSTGSCRADSCKEARIKCPYSKCSDTGRHENDL